MSQPIPIASIPQAGAHFQEIPGFGLVRVSADSAARPAAVKKSDATPDKQDKKH